MEFELSKIDAAVEQLDWAIKLFLDRQAYLPAITLAGDAEEILGRAIGDRGCVCSAPDGFRREAQYFREIISSSI
jgi:hypothetical protein